ncbi:MAG: DUF3365 domain-containing protein [Myxococcales bacterium]|nr:DUF3365 domain-containing protein [Myxococcales bacterium]
MRTTATRLTLAIGLTLALTGCNKPASNAKPVKAPKHKKVLGGGEVDLGAPPPKVAAALKSLKMGLKGRLQAAMKAGGPVNALAACNTDAAKITASSQADGITLGRTSDRLRNPKNKAPAWATKYVQGAAGKRLDKVPGRMTVDIGGGKKGYLEMIGTAGLCLTCHGPSADLSPKLKTRLAKLYPDDKATGYSAGEVRGWFWAEYTP